MRNVLLAITGNAIGIRTVMNHCARGALFLLAFVSFAAQAQPLSFDAAIQQAMSTSPEVAARESQVEATRSAAIPAGALPDPKLFAGLDTFPITGPNAGTFNDDFTMVTAGVMQELTNAGKRSARIARAQAAIGEARAEVDAHHREVAVGAGLAWLDVFYAERRTAARVGPLHVERLLLWILELAI